MRILIWGTGNLCKRFMKFEYFMGHEIVGFIETHKSKDFFMGYPIYEPKQVCTLDVECIVVAIEENNNEILEMCMQEQIALKKIVLTSRSLKSQNIKEIYRKNIMANDQISIYFPVLYKDIIERSLQYEYIYDSTILCNDLYTNTLIKEVGDSHVVVWIPIELIFSEMQEDSIPENYTEEWLVQNKQWQDIPLISFMPYRNLYEFFLIGKDYPNKYCKWFQNLFLTRKMKLEYTEEELIEKRFREFRIMQKELNQGMQFFIDHPAIGKWNKKGYFNLLDGHHRVSFLYSSGLTQMPVQVKKEDYILWCNEDIAKQVHKVILRQNRTEFYQPIYNPYFLHLHPHRDNFAKSRLHHFLEYFSEKRFYDKKIVDIGANLGYMGQAFNRMGADVTLIEFDKFHYELTGLINQLLYCDCKLVTERFENIENCETYDIAILLTVFYHYFSNEVIREKFIERLNNHVKEMILWESGDEPEKEKAYLLQHTKFKNYHHLSYTYATGKFRELGIFMTSDSEYLLC